MNSMIAKLALAPVLAAAILYTVGFAKAEEVETVDVPCMPKAQVPKLSEFTPLTHDQWIAARVMFYSAPSTPAAFPPGNEAMLRVMEGGTGALIFLDGGDACAPIMVGKTGVELLDKLAKKSITHPLGRM